MNDDAFLDRGLVEFGNAVRAVHAFHDGMKPRLAAAVEAAAAAIPGFSSSLSAKATSGLKDPYGPSLGAGIQGALGERKTCVAMECWWTDDRAVVYVDLNDLTADDRRKLHAVESEGIELIDFWSCRRLACRLPEHVSDLTGAAVKLARALAAQLELR